jgi:hypothetical protein
MVEERLRYMRKWVVALSVGLLVVAGVCAYVLYALTNGLRCACVSARSIEVVNEDGAVVVRIDSHMGRGRLALFYENGQRILEVSGPGVKLSPSGAYLRMYLPEDGVNDDPVAAVELEQAAQTILLGRGGTEKYRYGPRIEMFAFTASGESLIQLAGAHGSRVSLSRSNESGTVRRTIDSP